jgi:hypothetical protein
VKPDERIVHSAPHRDESCPYHVGESLGISRQRKLRRVRLALNNGATLSKIEGEKAPRAAFNLCVVDEEVDAPENR